jgi:hypothetical protein
VVCRSPIDEHHNRAADLSDKVRELSAKLDVWRQSVGAIMPTVNKRLAAYRSQ